MAAFGAQASDLPRQLQASDFPVFPDAQVKLGQLLFFDPILSGNRNISCATCHSPEHGTTDGLPLGIGEGGHGVGPKRSAGTGDDRIKKRIPRNAPALWNLGAKDIHTMFHDGRVHVADIYENGFNTPAQEWLPDGLDSVLAVQALFPMTSEFEMAGNPKENQVAGAVYDRIDNVWPILAKRVRVIPEYAQMFVAAYDDVESPLDINIVHIGNALAAFQATEFQSFDSPFDAYLAGEGNALSAVQKAGMDLFYGKAGCSACHSGPLFTDQEFHAITLPHFGPGRTRMWDPIVRDVGHMGVSDRLEDAYRFRTPSLRNVALTAPYGHNGAYATLEGIVRHHLDPAAGFAAWTPEKVTLPEVPWLASVDFVTLQDKQERARQAAAGDLEPVGLNDEEVAQIVAFLQALTGTDSIKGRLGRPHGVPSGLEVD
ncbi:methylamine utilization protein MauG [Pseudoruegeria sp. M32A2M]|nr:methylamine utilization protein MauG [Pseudoruegeria sp. M32A2M]